jgi:hypothetical protein
VDVVDAGFAVRRRDHLPGLAALGDRIDRHAAQVTALGEAFQGRRPGAGIGVVLVDGVAHRRQILLQHRLLGALDVLEIARHRQGQQGGDDGQHHQQFNQGKTAFDHFHNSR